MAGLFFLVGHAPVVATVMMTLLSMFVSPDGSGAESARMLMFPERRDGTPPRRVWFQGDPEPLHVSGPFGRTGSGGERTPPGSCPEVAGQAPGKPSGESRPKQVGESRSAVIRFAGFAGAG